MGKGPNSWKNNLQRAVCEWLTAHPDTTAGALAARAEVDRGDMSRIVNGEKPSLHAEKAVALAEAMGLTAEDLVNGRSKPALAPQPPIDATTDVRGTLRMLSLEQLTVNPLNPRKAFEDDALGELADSIASDGILQNLVIAPAGKDGRHIVIAGGRRQRALLKLADQVDAATGQPRWNRTAPNIPCRILAGEEPRVRALALVENLQRVDLSPMEEAQAFDELQHIDAKVWTTAHIAETVHRTQRFVQQRLALARNLAPKGQRLLADGKITVEMARTLTMAPKKQQTEILARIETTDDTESAWTVGDVREQLTDDWIESDRAFFDKSTYKGEKVIDDDTGTIWFCDKKLFKKMQRAAAAAKVKELESQRAWVKLIDISAGQHFNDWDYNKVKRKDLSETGAVVKIGCQDEVEIVDGLVKRETTGAGKSSTRSARGSARQATDHKPETPPFTDRLLAHVRATKTEYLQDAIARRSVADEGDTAMCLAIIGLLGVDRQRIGLREEERRGREDVQGEHVRGRLRTIYAEIVALAPSRMDAYRAAGPEDDEDPDAIELDVDDDGSQVADEEDDTAAPAHAARVRPPYFQGKNIATRVWEWLRFKTRPERIEIFSMLVADRCGFLDFAFKAPAAHTDFDRDLVSHVGLSTAALWQPDKEWLDASRKPRLEALARAIRLQPIPKSTTQLREAIAARFAAAAQSGGEPLPPADDWLPPEMRILDKAALEQELHLEANAAKTPVKTKDAGEQEARA